MADVNSIAPGRIAAARYRLVLAASRMASVASRVVAVAGCTVLTAGCAGSFLAPGPSVASDSPGQSAAAADAKDAACPAAQARFLTCGNGVRLVTYEPAYDLARYCEPVQAIEARVRGFDRNRPLMPLAGGERVLLVGDAGWLLLPPEAGILEVPSSMAAWWTNRACTLPSAIAGAR